MQSSLILYTFVLRAEIPTTFGPKMVAISACNTKVYKICKLCKAIVSVFYNISPPQLVILLILVCSFYSCGDLFASPCLVLKLVYNENQSIVDKNTYYNALIVNSSINFNKP